ncbi:MAG: ATP-binding protein [Gammaproteobacteria bacterium]
MKLRAQLIVVSLFALFLPWAGCSFIYEMESVLRSGQQDALAALAGSVALLVEDRAAPEDLLARAEMTGQGIYFYSDASIPIVDGYAEDGPESSMRLASFSFAGGADSSLAADYLGIVDADEAYVFIRVVDPSIRYHNPAESDLASGDHVVIAMGRAGDIRRYWLAPEAPGEFLARYRTQGAAATEPRVRGVWRDNATGYQLELRFPEALLQERFGFAAVDSDGGGSAGSMAPRAMPGRVVRMNEALTELLTAYGREDLRLRVVDRDGWVVARAGKLARDFGRQEHQIPGAWMVEALYRAMMSAGDELAGMGGDTRARVDRREVESALRGQQASAWYGVEAERGAAVASVALPLNVADNVVGALVAEQSSGRILSLTNAAVLRLLVVTLLATFLISFGLVAYASLLSMRIRRLGRRVDAALTDDGQISGEFPQNWAGDEIGDLGRNFGSLLERMREYNDYLKSLASKLSHELRTPLAVVSSSLDNLEHESMSESGRQYTRRARDGSERLSRILTAMSEASRVEQGIRSAGRIRLDLAELLDRNVASYRQAFGRAVDCRLPDEPLWIEGSPDLLAQMLDKLMDNAADFCPDDGRIAFTLTADAEHGVILVDNAGPALPAQMRGELFESMVSIRPEKRGEPHLGLGLTIVRLVAEFHGGNVHAEDLPDGVRFTVVLPQCE